MIKFFKRIISLRRFTKLANSVGYNLKDPHPVESLAFQTIAAIKLSPQKDFSLKHNELTMYDTIIFTLFILRMNGISIINNKTKAEMFSDFYIRKVTEYFPEGHNISKKYDSDYFAERVKYYDSLLTDTSYSFDERIKNVVEAFKTIIMHDYIGQYMRFNKNSPLPLFGLDMHFKISIEVELFYDTLPVFFNKILKDIDELYN